MLSGSGPDIVYTAGPSYVASMAQAGQLLPLDDYAAKARLERPRSCRCSSSSANTTASSTRCAKTYETLGLFYNKTLFDKNGWKAPTTIAELEALADDDEGQGIVPFAAGNADWRPTNEHYVSIVLNSIAGPENVYKALTGAIPWTDPSFVAAIDKLNEWWQKGYFGPNYFSLTGEQAFAQVATGQAGMAPTGTWNFSNVPDLLSRRTMPSRASSASRSADGGPTRSLRSASARPSRSTPTRRIADGAAAVLDYIFIRQVLRRHELGLAGRVEPAAARTCPGQDRRQGAAALHRGDEDAGRVGEAASTATPPGPSCRRRPTPIWSAAWRRSG